MRREGVCEGGCVRKEGVCKEGVCKEGGRRVCVRRAMGVVVVEIKVKTSYSYLAASHSITLNIEL